MHIEVHRKRDDRKRVRVASLSQLLTLGGMLV